MRLYSGSSREFIQDVGSGQIADRLKESFYQHYQMNPSSSEYNSWQNSLEAMSGVLQEGALSNSGIIVEYQLPMSSARLDVMVTGMDVNSRAGAAIVELKQWQSTKPSSIEDCVVTFLGGRERDVLHPSRQVGQYRQYLADYLEVFSEDEFRLNACSYLHNMDLTGDSVLLSPGFTSLVKKYPLFAAGQSGDLAEFLDRQVGHGDGLGIVEKVLHSPRRPTRKLLEHVGKVIRGHSEYTLLDEQLVVFNSVLTHVKAGLDSQEKLVVLVRGGPGTGKSLIALNLVGDLCASNYNAHHATGSRAFTANVRKAVGSRAGVQFRYFNSYRSAERDELDVLVLDEAHRIREHSYNRYTPAAEKDGRLQIEELIDCAKVLVFFIDDLQVVRPGETGSTTLINGTSLAKGAKLLEFELETQFRCGGSDEYLCWVNDVLGFPGDEISWSPEQSFEFRIVDTVEELEAAIRARHREGHSARLAAGFCWKWSDPTPGGTLVPDVQLGTWSMPWNAKSDAGKLAPGIPPERYWASDPNGIDQVGCIYTAQGFEFDYCGVIFGRDLRYDPALGQWIGDPAHSQDGVVKRSKTQFLNLVKSVYRVLLTRGLRGCYVYFQDDDTRKFFESRIAAKR